MKSLRSKKNILSQWFLIDSANFILVCLQKHTIYLLIIFILISCKTSNKLEVITWKSKALEYKDFKGQCGQSHYIGFCTSFLSLQSNQNMQTNPAIAAIFIPQKSWLLNFSENLITHEQYHFNITELYARVFRKIVAENKIDSLISTFPKDSVSPSKLYNTNKYLKAYVIMNKQLLKLQLIYDNETNHSEKKIAQIRWQIHIDSLLKLHQDYYREYPDSLFLAFRGKQKYPISKK